MLHRAAYATHAVAGSGRESQCGRERPQGDAVQLGADHVQDTQGVSQGSLVLQSLMNQILWGPLALASEANTTRTTFVDS